MNYKEQFLKIKDELIWACINCHNPLDQHLYLKCATCIVKKKIEKVNKYAEVE